MSFKSEVKKEILAQGKDKRILNLTKNWMKRAGQLKYSYHFEWMGRPIIQHPQDIVATQQLIWSIKPDLIIETGIARGGSLIFYASLLELISQSGKNKNAKVLGIDIDIRKDNLHYIKKHPMFKRINLIEGSSIERKIYEKVYKFSKKFKKIMVFLDSNHTEKHVLKELEIYAKLVTKNSYCIVFDTIIEDLPEVYGKNRVWGKNNNPKSALKKYLNKIKRDSFFDLKKKKINFKIDKAIDSQILITVAPSGFLKRL
jgi:cephalosporin hydroxylase